MSWAEVEAALDGILVRRWYTNHGPLARELEAAVASTTGVRHAVVVTNPAIALMVLAEALDLSGRVLLPALAPVRCVQALRWAGLQPMFADRPDRADALLLARGAARAGLLEPEGARGRPVFSDGLVLPGVPAVIRLPGSGDDAGAGCVLTDRDDLAARLRNIRSSYGAGPAVPVTRTANGRLSEVQAAMCLLSWSPRPSLTLAEARRAWPNRRVIDLGDGMGVVMGSRAERDDWLQRCPGTGTLTPAVPRDEDPAAHDLAARLLLLPPLALQDAG